MTRCTIVDFGEAMVPDAGALPNFVTASPELPQGFMQSVGILLIIGDVKFWPSEITM